jgi:hypothetical protein
MSTLCRAEREETGRNIRRADLPTVADLSSIGAAATADAAKVGKSEGPCFCPMHFSAFLKWRVKGGRKVSDFSKNFGNISDKQPFFEKISDYFFRERDRPGRCAGRPAPHFRTKMCLAGRQTLRARRTRSPVKPARRMLNVVNAGSIMCKCFKINYLQNIRSYRVKPSQTHCCPAKEGFESWNRLRTRDLRHKKHVIDLETGLAHDG